MKRNRRLRSRLVRAFARFMRVPIAIHQSYFMCSVASSSASSGFEGRVSMTRAEFAGILMHALRTGNMAEDVDQAEFERHWVECFGVSMVDVVAAVEAGDNPFATRH